MYYGKGKKLKKFCQVRQVLTNIRPGNVPCLVAPARSLKSNERPVSPTATRPRPLGPPRRSVPPPRTPTSAAGRRGSRLCRRLPLRSREGPGRGRAAGGAARRTCAAATQSSATASRGARRERAASEDGHGEPAACLDGGGSRPLLPGRRPPLRPPPRPPRAAGSPRARLTRLAEISRGWTRRRRRKSASSPANRVMKAHPARGPKRSTKQALICS